MNPFEPIYEQMNRMESMILELKEQLDTTKEESLNDIEMAAKITGYSRNNNLQAR